MTNDLQTIQGFSVDFSSNKALAKSLEEITNGCKDDPEIAKLLKTMATIAMNEAGYISSGQYPVDQYYHYGLALEFYTHFTVSHCKKMPLLNVALNWLYFFLVTYS